MSARDSVAPPHAKVPRSQLKLLLHTTDHRSSGVPAAAGAGAAHTAKPAENKKFFSPASSRTGTSAVPPACPASWRSRPAFWRPFCRRRPEKRSSPPAAAGPASPGPTGTFRHVRPTTSRRRSPMVLGPAPAVSASTGTTKTAKTGRAAREDSQEKQRRPTHKTAPAETHRRTKPESGSPEPTSQPPHRSVAPVAPPSHRTKRITAVVPPASRSSGSSSSPVCP